MLSCCVGHFTSSTLFTKCGFEAIMALMPGCWSLMPAQITYHQSQFPSTPVRNNNLCSLDCYVLNTATLSLSLFTGQVWKTSEII